MHRPAVVQLIAVLACVGLLVAAATRMPSINAGRKALSMYGADSPLENTPPEYVFYIQAFGAFRGLIADIAFIRAEQLKEQGRFYDAMTLHKWICAFQPHFPTVWEYASWNMAWNISVTTFTSEERWNWVYNGVKLLRDQGIPLNPRAVNLYRQLAWTFNNKMSETTDDQNYAYKCNWAWRMHLVLGAPADPLAELDTATLADEMKSTDDIDLLEQAGRRTRALLDERADQTEPEKTPPPKPREPNQPSAEARPGEAVFSQFRLAQRAAYERMRAIKEAPASLPALYERYPDTRRMVAELRALGIDINDDVLSEDTYWRAEGLAFAFFKPYRELLTPAATLARLAQLPAGGNEETARRSAIDQILGVTADNPAGKALVHFLQRKVLLEVYKNDPAYMLELIETFGPLDWRSVDAQALYWVSRGLIAGGETISQFSNDKTNTARIIFFCLRNLFVRGRIVFEPNPDKIQLSYLNLSRDMDFIEPMHQAYVKYGPLFDLGSTAGKPVIGAGSTFRSGHVNFLTEAIRLLYLSGREADAAHYYAYLRDTYSVNAQGQLTNVFDKSLHDFVIQNFVESMSAAGPREIALALGGWLYNAYNELAAGNVAAYVRLVNVARKYHENYMRDKRGDRGSERVYLPEFIDIQVDAFGTWFVDQPSGSPAYLLHKTRLWRRAPLYLRQAVYDDLAPRFKAECDAWNFDVTRVFPEPKGMAEYRAQHPERYQKEREGKIENLPRLPG